MSVAVETLGEVPQRLLAEACTQVRVTGAGVGSGTDVETCAEPGTCGG